MFQIASISVDGFWDTYSFELSFEAQTVCFIGQNGTGKTTLVNLIAAALTADFRTLDRLPFKRIQIELVSRTEKRRPQVTVYKSSKKGRPYEGIEYRIRSGVKGDAEAKFSLEEAEEQASLRRYLQSGMHSMYFRRMTTGVLARLNEMVVVNWLSIHRATLSDRSKEERSYESSVDQKMESLSNDLIRYISTLSQQKDTEVRSFQETMFASLLEQQGDFEIFDVESLEKIDYYSHILHNIFDELHVKEDYSRKLISSFVERARAARGEITVENGIITSLSIDGAIMLIGLRRVEAVVKNWAALQDKQRAIFRPVDNFTQIVNQLFSRKTLHITASNEMSFSSRTGKNLTYHQLSSGEKQLLILLSETLLQKEEPAIFIADEPELSLHVLWQEKLISSIQSLNPAAQIIVATHSPDIVGPVHAQIVDMERVIP